MTDIDTSGPADDTATPQPTVTRLAATVERLRAEIARAQAAADGRALIEMAKGVLVERLRCGPTQAARQLDALADQAGVTALELAAELVNQAAQDKLSATVEEFLQRTAEPEQSSAAVRLRTAESALLATGDPQRVAQSVLEHALVPLGATAVAIWSVGTDGSLSLVGFAGIDLPEAERWRYVPPGVPTPARRALGPRDAQWVENLAAPGLPAIGARPGGRGAGPGRPLPELPCGLCGRAPSGLSRALPPDRVPRTEPGRNRQRAGESTHGGRIDAELVTRRILPP
ncbi:ANTAR domain-containing protein [Nocardia farcinica]|uniref:ANTAR domain-containing protein n=1 Tax=Nocardia farcinica TaxID=37329 RepID=UPI00245761EB|nr:ANTAR domain-containing protein [Nocardia farcinica]